MAFGRTVTANEPSSSGATLTDGTQAPLARELLEQRRLDVAREPGHDDGRCRPREVAGGRATRSTPSLNAVERRPSRARTSAALRRIFSPVFLTGSRMPGVPETVGTTTTSTTGAESPNAAASDAAVNERGSQRW